MFRRRIGAAAIVLAAGLCVVRPAAAQLAARPAEEWIKLLDAPARIAGLKVDEVVAGLRLKPGDVVADLGTGSGVFTVPLARAVSPSGKVYAVDIDQRLLDYVAEKARAQKVANITTVLGKFADPSLPAADVDVAFMHDVLHHIADPAAYLKNAARYLKPGGRFAIVDPDAHKGPHADDPKLQVTKAQLRGWMSDAGLALSEDIPLGADKWYVIYTRK